jgi:hypothetical protein
MSAICIDNIGKIYLYKNRLWIKDCYQFY